MMRALLGSVVVLIATALLAAAVAVAAPFALSATARPRSTRVSASPAPDDLALVELHFRNGGRRQLTLRSLQLAVSGPFGDDYLAGATALASSAGGPRLLVLIVNRPSPLEDPASVRLLVRSRRALGIAQVEKLTNPFSDPHRGNRAMCSLRLPAANPAGALRPLQRRGAALRGFASDEAVADAYEVACGVAEESAFREAVTQTPAAPSPTPPAPVPPTPRPPGCTPCPPEPGIACPLALSPDICIASLADAAMRAAAGAH